MIQEGFQCQIHMMIDKLNEAENKLCGSSHEAQQSNTLITSNEQKGAETENIGPAHLPSLSSEPAPETAKSEDQKETGCKRNQQISGVPGTWSCDVCLVQNKADDSEDIALPGVAKPLSSREECDHDGEESEDSTDESSSYFSAEEDDSEWDIGASLLPAQRPTAQSPQTPPSFSLSQAKGTTTPVKPVPVHSTQADPSVPAHPSNNNAMMRFLVAKSPIKGAKKQDEDCILVYEVRASIADREKANRLFLPPNFFNYTKQEACPGYIGCRAISKEVANVNKKVGKEHSAIDTTPSTKETITKPGTNTSASHVFGETATFGQLTFSSLKVEGDNLFSQAKKKDDQKPFQGAGMQVFSEPIQGAEGQDNDNVHFEPIIPLPAEIQVVTGEEGLEVMFSERAKLYRFDVDSGQWKERGVGDVKLLRHPASGRGRVLMRREQIKKLCANHNITAGMELKPNVGSDRSWVWYTSADYADGEAKPEKLAIKFKTSKMALKFKKVFDDLIEPLSSEPSPEVAKTEEQKDPGCKLYQELMSTLAAAPGAWSCDVCYVDNKADDLTCVACNSVRPGAEVSYSPVKTGEETSTNASVVESEEPNTFQDLNKGAAPSSFVFQSTGAKGLSSSQLFTIGRVDPNEDTADDEIDVSPSKTSSPSKQGIIPPQKPLTPPSQSAQLTGPFGTGTPSKFTFSLVVSLGSPVRKPISPISHVSPQSPESPVHGDDDGPHFEPLIPLPEKVECLTGEEGQEILFCERCKLFRYDSDTSQWKERGVGYIKILRNPSSGRHRVLMRRVQIFKLCANHMISVDMELKPFPKSDRAWLWTTLADFSEEVAKAETLAARFRTNEIARQFKGTFDKAVHFFASKTNAGSLTKPEGTQPDQPIEGGAASPGSEILCGSRKAGFSFGFLGTTEGVGKPAFSFDTSSSSSFGFSALKLTLEHNKHSRTRAQDEGDKKGEQTPSDVIDGTKGDDPHSNNEGGDGVEDSNKKETPVKAVQDEDEKGLKDGVWKSLLVMWKPKEVAWECDICMVRNNSDAVKCEACESPKPGVEQSQDQKPGGKSLVLFGSGVASSRTGLTFG